MRRFGTEATAVLANAVSVTGLAPAELVWPVAPPLAVTLAELVFAVTHESATTVADLLDGVGGSAWCPRTASPPARPRSAP